MSQDESDDESDDESGDESDDESDDDITFAFCSRLDLPRWAYYYFPHFILYLISG
jgi:hypothetical protein